MKKGLLALVLATVGCASAPPRIREIDDRGAAKCEFVTTVDGGAAFDPCGGLPVTMVNARADAWKQAMAAGATHVLWTHASTGFVSGRAYRCPLASE